MEAKALPWFDPQENSPVLPLVGQVWFVLETNVSYLLISNRVS
jgi:hypothetical protein